MENKNSDHGGSIAPVSKATTATVAPPALRRRLTPERRGGTSSPRTARLPQIRGGICEYCGVIDNTLPSQEQYKLCRHYRDIGEVQCSYCSDGKDPVDVILRAVMNVAVHPDKPNQLVVWCNQFTCSEKHLKRFSTTER